MPFLGLFSPAVPMNGSQHKWTTFGYNSKQNVTMTVVDTNSNEAGHLVDKTLSSSEESLQWEDFYGSQTSDLAPTLLDIYDALFQSQQTTIKGNCNNDNSINISNVPTTDLDNQSNNEIIIDPTNHLNGQISNWPLSVASSSSSVIDLTSSSSSSSISAPILTKNGNYIHQDSARRLSSHSQTSFGCHRENTNQTEINCSRSSSGISETPTIEDHLYRLNGSNGNSWLFKPKFFNDQSLSYVQKVTMELVETEKTYVNDLQEIIQGYFNYLNTGCFQDQIGSQNISDLFGNIEDVFNFNQELLKKLDQCCSEPSSVAKCFVEAKAGFSVYTLYCTNYPKTVSVLTELMRNEKTADIFKMRQIALGHLLPLGSFLLKPVQRILKYHLLLQNMCKHYVKDLGGSNGVMAEALATMTDIAHSINEMKRKYEHAVRVQEIQSLLYGWRGDDLTTYGELIAEGTFHIYGAKGVRHCFLFDKMLLIAKKREDISLTYKTHIMCSNLMLIESVNGEPLCFHVLPFDSPKLQYTLKARSLDQKREWSLQLKRVILENYNVDIPSHARQIVMQLGQQPEDGVPQVDVGGGIKSHLAPQYLDRRKQEKKKIGALNIKALRIKKGANGKYKAIRSTEDLIKVKKSKCKWRKTKEQCDLISSVESLAATSSDFVNSPSIGLSDSQEYVSFYLPSKDEQAIYDIPCAHGPIDHSITSFEEIPQSPTEPSVWLKQHMSTSPAGCWPKVGHSLPRSFHLNTSNAIKRPFTIASDKISTNIFDDFDYTYANSSCDDVYDDVSADLDSVHHPEHRIYRSSSLSRSSLRSLVTHLSSKLSSIKMTQDVVDVRHALMVSLAQAYNKMTKKSPKVKQTEEPIMVIHRQGSSALGARMAKPLAEDVDYAVPCITRPSMEDNHSLSEIETQQNSIEMDVREDSVTCHTDTAENLIDTTINNTNMTDNTISSNIDDNLVIHLQNVTSFKDILARYVDKPALNLKINTTSVTNMNSLSADFDIATKDFSKSCQITNINASSAVKTRSIFKLPDSCNNLKRNSIDGDSKPEQNNLNGAIIDVSESHIPNRVKETLRQLEQSHCKASHKSVMESEELSGIKSIRERLRALEHQTSQSIQQVGDNQSENVTQGWVKQVVNKFQK